MLDGKALHETFVRLPLKMFNRHGLIAGATGTGKTKTLQIIAEQLSANGVPSLVMDVKGDLSGIAAKSPGHPKIDERHEKIGLPFIPGTSPVEFLSLSFIISTGNCYFYCGRSTPVVYLPSGRQISPLSLQKLCGCGSMAEHFPSKEETRVRFPSPAPSQQS